MKFKFKNILIVLSFVMILFVCNVVSFDVASATDNSFTSEDLESLISKNVNGTIDLPHDRAILLKHNIEITKSLKINGNGLIIKNSEVDPFGFIVSGNGRLELSDIEFDRGTYPITVQRKGYLKCNRCDFNSCKGSIKLLNGMAILYGSNIGYGTSFPQINVDKESNLSANGCNFHDNNIIGVYEGSSISCSGKSNVNLINSTFNRNSAFRGGSVYLSDSNNVNIEGCNIHNNYANVSGGFLYVDGSNTVNLINNKFVGNSANIDKENSQDIGGGACMFLSGLFNVSVVSNVFTDNKEGRGNFVLTINTNYFSKIYGRSNRIDDYYRFSSHVFLINCPRLTLDIEDD